MRTKDLSELIGFIYDTSLDPDAWSVMLNHLADAFGSSGAAIGSYNSSTHVSAHHAPRADPEMMRSYDEYWVRHNVIWKRSANHPVGEAMMPEMFMRRDEYLRTSFFNEWCKPHGIEALLGTNLLSEGSVSTVASVARPFAKGDFEHTEIEVFTALIPHLQRAMQLQLRLAGLDGPPESSAEILNRLTQGVLLVDAQARVIFANLSAEKMLRTGVGLFSGRDGLRAKSLSETRLLRQTVAECAQPISELGGTGGRLRLSREDRAPLTALVIPHRSRFSWVDVVRPRAILFITDPEQPLAVSGEWLRQDFGLTAAEAAFTLEILKGDGVPAAAQRFDISPATARTHLARVFDKTGTRRQAELVRWILQSQPTRSWLS